MDLDRHYAATTYLLHRTEKKTLLHWHKKLQTWLPPGGHVEENEDPFQAAKREIREEYGLENLEFIHPNNKEKLDNRSYLLEMPHFLIEEDIAPNHIHLDWIFFAWVEEEEGEQAIVEMDVEIKWFSINELNSDPRIFDNVKLMAIKALDTFYS